MTKPQVGPAKVSTSNVEKTTTQRLKTGELVPQAGGGALRNGGTNKGGSGRPREIIRTKFRDLITTEGFTYLREALASPRSYVLTCPECNHNQVVNPPKTDEIAVKVIDLCARYGIGTQQEVEHTGTVQLVHDVPSRPESMP